MAENTKIEWAHHTFNPWIGCTKVSPACDHCYAEADFATRRKVVQWGAGQPRKHTAPSTWSMPLRWNAEAERLGVRYRVFSASLADVFDNAVPVQWRRDLFDLIEKTPHLDWLLLTKRIGNARNIYAEAYLDSARAWPANVWIGATIVNQEEADRDIPKLLAVPAAKRFLSMEPLLGPVDLSQALAGYMQHFSVMGDAYIDWVIVGGESGPQARPMHPDWARSLRDQCEAAGVPFLFKQWGEWAPVSESPVHPESTRIPGNLCRVTRDGATADHYVAISTNGGRQRYELQRVGKKAAGRLLDGRTWDGTPQSGPQKPKQWWDPHPLDPYDQWKLLEIAESANPPTNKPDEFGNVEMPAKDGWKVVFFYDCGELDYIESFITPEGVSLDVRDTGYQSEQWPPVMTWREVGDLERLRAYTNNERAEGSAR